MDQDDWVDFNANLDDVKGKTADLSDAVEDLVNSIVPDWKEIDKLRHHVKVIKTLIRTIEDREQEARAENEKK